jgi:hypothetical protein
LKQHVDGLYQTLVNKLPQAQQQEIASIVQNNNASQLCQRAVTSWYFENAPLTAVALAAKACGSNMKNGLALNNLSALLIEGSAVHKAVPILRYLTVRYPKDPMILNNMGQAFAVLGVKDSAKYYLARCVKASPHHPEANATLGRIAASDGNKQQAAAYANQSLKGANNEAARELMDATGMSPLYPTVYRESNLPDRFNAYKFQLPPLQQTVDEANRVEAEWMAFREALEKEEDKLSPIAEELNAKGQELLEKEQAKLVAALKDGSWSPSGNEQRLFAGNRIQMAVFTKQNQEYLESMGKWKTAWQAQLEQLDAALAKRLENIRVFYAAEMSKYDCGEGNGKGCVELDRLGKERCEKLNAATNDYLKSRAMAMDDIIQKMQNLELKSFFKSSYWGYMGAPNKYLAKAGYYNAALGYVGALKSICSMVAACGKKVPECRYLDEVKKERMLSANWDFECPVDVSIPLVIGELNIDCESISLSASAGASFKFTQNFRTRQSTLSIGIGLDLEKSIESEMLPGVEGKGTLTLEQVLYITYDGKKQVTDLGMKFGASVSAGYEVSDVAKELTGMEDGSLEGKFGYTFGVNSQSGSHMEFDDGPLKEIFAPTPVQVNPKVGLYNK